ncbi:hypothetical protein CRG98_027028 [Punica granatum]|uniref:Uncharacterized protein n=1 Tax=Punica granatum TaxID=22663 RepID=A0A2I0J9N2_PUNGR|nr:hypothetical protein CRG98_027028 [Punica granatum]
MHGVTPLQELLSGLIPYTSTRKGLNAEVPPTKPKTKATERATGRQRDYLNRRQAWPPRQTSPSTSRAHLSRRHPLRSHKARSGMTIAEGACHGLHQQPRPGHSHSTFAPRPPRKTPPAMSISKRHTLGHPRLKFVPTQPRQATYTEAPLVEICIVVTVMGYSGKRH